MKVELRTEFSGLRNGEHWPKRGEVVDLPNDEAVELLNAGHAVAVKAAAPQTASLKK